MTPTDEPTATLDLTGVPCPQNTARALLELEFMDEDETLLMVLDEGEPMENVPPALELEGHRIIHRQRAGSRWMLTVKPALEGSTEED